MKAEQIIALRKHLGLTQKELAGRLKVDSITISRWERGTQRPLQSVIRRIERLIKKGGK